MIFLNIKVFLHKYEMFLLNVVKLKGSTARHHVTYTCHTEVAGRLEVHVINRTVVYPEMFVSPAMKHSDHRGSGL